MELPADLLDRPVEEAARRLALALLARAEEAAGRLADPLDAEALHDFRVAVRRLRSTVRAYRPWLAESVPRPLRRRLRALGDATNPARDAEVQLAWLEGARPGLRPHERPGHRWLLARAEARRRVAIETVRAEVPPLFAGASARLRRRLARFTVAVELEGGWQPLPLRRALADELTAHAAALAAALGRIGSIADAAEAHAARIEAKRLRYLLEPLAALVPGAKGPLARLRALQDLLGELHDADLLGGVIEEATAEAAAGRARHLHQLALAASEAELRAAGRRSERSGLLALARRLATRRQELFAALAAGWLDGRGAGLEAEVAALAHALAPAP